MTSPNGTEATAEILELEDETFQTELTDEAYEELVELEGSQVVGVAFWDSSLADELDEEEPEDEARSVLDLDLYLEDNALLELYGAVLYINPEDGPLMGLAAMEEALIGMVDSESVLQEIAESEDGALVLVFAAEDAVNLLIAVSAWVVSEWDELPED